MLNIILEYIRYINYSSVDDNFNEFVRKLF